MLHASASPENSTLLRQLARIDRRARLVSLKKMMLLNALDGAQEVTLAGAQLVVRFSDEQAALRNSLDLSRAAVEKIAREVTGRTVRVTTVVGGSDAPAVAAPVEPAAESAQAAVAAASESAEVPSDPIVQAVIETFQGKLLAFEPPPEEN